MLIGIARTSTLEQKAGLEAQLRELEAYSLKRYTKSKYPLLRRGNN